MKHTRSTIIYSGLIVLLTIIMSFSIKTRTEIKKPVLLNAASSQNVSLSISGTSSLHDWKMNSEKGKVEVLLSLGANGKLLGLPGLKFVLDAESLKSDSKMMDNNAYKALKTSSVKNINFLLSSTTLTQVNETTYQVKALGKLSIAGTTKETDIIATIKYSAAEKGYIVSGSKKLKMTDYKVKPPTFMFGTVKTGDEITISFKTKITE